MAIVHWALGTPYIALLVGLPSLSWARPWAPASPPSSWALAFRVAVRLEVGLANS